VLPVLSTYCFGCHAEGARKGGVAFDEFASDADLLASRDLWWKALRNLRAGVMPPAKKPHPSAEEIARVAAWIELAVFRIDPRDPDPGHVTLRRLNRTEYANTVRDLLGVEFATDVEFPPDDTGYGFDNIGEVLTLSPILLEKYMAAAASIVGSAVPMVAREVSETKIPGRAFRTGDAPAGGRENPSTLSLSFYEPATVSTAFRAELDGSYELVLDLTVTEKFVEGVFDYNRCEVVFRADGEELLKKESTWQPGKSFRLPATRRLNPGEHALGVEVRPLTPDEKRTRSLELRINSVLVRGPLEEEHWVRSKRHERFFSRLAPEAPNERRAYARELLEKFAGRAFRRPVDAATLDRLVALAETTYTQPGRAFEAGIAQAFVAVLASPRFIFREEPVDAAGDGSKYPFVDEYALASRLSYFLWSSMPDEELFALASERKLRAQLAAQTRRMLADPRARAFFESFAGQWLQARDVENVPIDARAVLAREEKIDPEVERLRARFRELRNRPERSLTDAEKEEFEKVRAAFFKSFGRVRIELTGDLRRAMRRETEMYFEDVVKNDRSLLELVDSDYTFLNERLAKHYGVPGVEGDQLRRVQLPAGSPRGGLLTQGTILAVTSNPTRTSPVKRGLFILENFLGFPPPPPPPDVPALEDAAKDVKDHVPSLRETLEIHRSKALCSSCHSRMDPLGLAFENFNAMGLWREKERDQAIDSSGKLITGEPFSGVTELKHLLATERRSDFYRCVTEKLFTYALGRGLQNLDEHAVDDIVRRLEAEGGRPSALLLGIVESPQFLRRRPPQTEELLRAF
jgi:hypothetical protein